MASTFPVISDGEIIGAVTDGFQLKTPWCEVQLCSEDELTLLGVVKFSVVVLSVVL